METGREPDSLEGRAVRHCAPTLAGIKCGSMFLKRLPKDQVIGGIRSMNRKTSRLGVVAVILRAEAGGAIVYVYRPVLLAESLSDPQVKSFLEGLGYRDGSASSLVRSLSERFTADRMPHEVGVFLGHPLEDVVGFIENGGKGCSGCGCWKCYGDPSRALDMFDRCRECSARLSRLFMDGEGIGSLCACPTARARRSFINQLGLPVSGDYIDGNMLSRISILTGIAGIVMVVASSFLGMAAFVVGAILAVVCIVSGIMLRKSGGKTSPAIMLGFFTFMILMFIGMSSMVTVEAGEKGLVVNSPAGNIGETIDEGWHFDPKYAFASVDYIRFNTQTVEYIGYDDDVDTVGGVTVLTKDSLNVNMDIAVTFHIPPSMVKKLRFEYGEDWKITILHQEVRSVPRLICVNYTALEIISDKRSDVESAITSNLSSQIMDRCGGCIVVDKVIIRELRIPQAMSDAVEKKLIAQQQLEKAQIDLERIQVEAEASKAAVDKVRESFDSDEAYLKYVLYETLKGLDGVQVVLTDGGTATVKVV